MMIRRWGMPLVGTVLMVLSGLAAAAGATLSGVASLSPELAAQVKPDDTVFVFARASQGPRMPLALQRTTVAALPYTFSLDDSQAMMPQMRLSSFATVDVVVRVSKGGTAMPASGDLEGGVSGVSNTSSGLELLIDRVLP